MAIRTEKFQTSATIFSQHFASPIQGLGIISEKVAFPPIKEALKSIWSLPEGVCKMSDSGGGQIYTQNKL